MDFKGLNDDVKEEPASPINNGESETCNTGTARIYEITFFLSWYARVQTAVC